MAISLSIAQSTDLLIHNIYKSIQHVKTGCGFWEVMSLCQWELKALIYAGFWLIPIRHQGLYQDNTGAFLYSHFFPPVSLCSSLPVMQFFHYVGKTCSHSLEYHPSYNLSHFYFFQNHLHHHFQALKTFCSYFTFISKN